MRLLRLTLLVALAAFGYAACSDDDYGRTCGDGGRTCDASVSDDAGLD